MRLRTLLLLTYAAAKLSACTDPSPSGEEPTDTVPDVKGIIASDPIATAFAARTLRIQGAAAEISYISLPSGSVAKGISARVRDLRTGETLPEVTVFSGGFDPVALAAAADDSLEIAVTDSSHVITLLKTTVPRKRPPAIVRTNPPKGRTDVATKVVPAIVFSEPIDPASLSGEIRLTSGSNAIAATVALDPEAPWVVEVNPTTALQPQTTYQMVVRAGVRDLEGSDLGGIATVSFTTGPALNFAGRVAFVSTREGSAAIYIANGDGSGVRRLINGDKPAWSPDGQQIVYQSKEAPNAIFTPGVEIRVVNADGTGDRRLASGIHPAWSPDGSRIAFADTVGIAVINVDGSGFKHLIRRDIILSYGPGFYAGAPAWSPNGTRIAFEHTDGEFPQIIAVMNADGSGARVLVPAPQLAECSPSWSPNGSVAFWEFITGLVRTDSLGNSLGSLYAAPLVNLSCFSTPEWSSDGSSLSFTLYTDDGRSRDWRGRIYVVSAQGGVPHQLIPDVVAPQNPSYTDRDPSWSRLPR